MKNKNQWQEHVLQASQDALKEIPFLKATIYILLTVAAIIIFLFLGYLLAGFGNWLDQDPFNIINNYEP